MARFLSFILCTFAVFAHAQDRVGTDATQPIIVTEAGFLPASVRVAVEPGAFHPVALGPAGSAPRGARLVRALSDGTRVYEIDASDLPIEAQTVLDDGIMRGIMPYVEGAPFYGVALAGLFPSRSLTDLAAIIDPQLLDADEVVQPDSVGMLGLAREGARALDLTPFVDHQGNDQWLSYVGANPTPHP